MIWREWIVSLVFFSRHIHKTKNLKTEIFELYRERERERVLRGKYFQGERTVELMKICCRKISEMKGFKKVNRSELERVSEKGGRGLSVFEIRSMARDCLFLLNPTVLK